MAFPSSVITLTSYYFVCVCFCVCVFVCTSLASYISIALREVTPLCVCFLFCLCFLCLCSCFMCLCFGVYQLGELHFHRITWGNQVTTGIHRPLSPSPILSKPATTPHFWTWINPALYACCIFSDYFTAESNSSSSPYSKAWHIGFLEGRCQRGILIRSQSITHFNKRCQLTQDKQEIMHSLLSEDFKQPAVRSTLFFCNLYAYSNLFWSNVKNLIWDPNALIHEWWRANINLIYLMMMVAQFCPTDNTPLMQKTQFWKQRHDVINNRHSVVSQFCSRCT